MYWHWTDMASFRNLSKHVQELRYAMEPPKFYMPPAWTFIVLTSSSIHTLTRAFHAMRALLISRFCNIDLDSPYDAWPKTRYHIWSGLYSVKPDLQAPAWGCFHVSNFTWLSRRNYTCWDSCFSEWPQKCLCKRLEVYFVGELFYNIFVKFPLYIRDFISSNYAAIKNANPQ